MSNTNNQANVTTGKPKIGGAVFRAPVGTPLPTDATTELNAAFVGLGYVSEDGTTNSNGIETQQFKDWNGDIIFSERTGSKDDFKLKLIEAKNVNVLKTVYGDSNVTGDITTGIKVKVNSNDVKEYSYVIEMILKDDTLKRVVIPQASITNIGDVVYNATNLIGYDVTFSASKDNEGNTHYEYIKAAEAASSNNPEIKE